jgi:PIN domain nuclease of toxin-antitoxin system
MISVASVWEVAIKHRIGKLPVAPVLFRDQCLAAGAGVLTINDAHVIETGRLAGVHEDPFDRLIIAQARIEGMTAVSSDSRWQEYDVALRRL